MYSVGINVGVPIRFSLGRIQRVEMRKVFVCPEPDLCWEALVLTAQVVFDAVTET